MLIQVISYQFTKNKLEGKHQTIARHLYQYLIR